MDRYKRKDKSCFIKLTITSIFTILLFALTSYNIFKCLNTGKSISKNKKELIIIKKELKKQEKNKIDLENQINNLNNLKQNIENQKKETFELAKKLELKIMNNETNYKIAYITFDDGPYYLTYKVLDTLKQNKIKATFFTIGLGKESCYDNNNEDCTKLYKKIVNEGHTIANHTYSHAIFKGLYESPNAFIEQIKMQENLIKEKTNITTNITRFPGGSTTAGNLKNEIIEKLRQNNYGWIDWSAQDGDGGNLNDTDTAWINFVNTINENIEVILFHDYSNITLSILPDAIKYLQDNNYVILPLFYNSIKVNK
ncbi:MAG: polysaccharide deacetylase family protein [bacterium]|nr:polysaccharide deacetylase family protein [bacterium]